MSEKMGQAELVGCVVLQAVAGFEKATENKPTKKRKHNTLFLSLFPASPRARAYVYIPTLSVSLCHSHIDTDTKGGLQYWRELKGRSIA